MSTTQTVTGVVEAVQDGRATVRYLRSGTMERLDALVGPVRGVQVGGRVVVQVKGDVALVVGTGDVDAPLPARKRCASCGKTFYAKGVDGCRCEAPTDLLA